MLATENNYKWSAKFLNNYFPLSKIGKGWYGEITKDYGSPQEIGNGIYIDENHLLFLCNVVLRLYLIEHAEYFHRAPFP